MLYTQTVEAGTLDLIKKITLDEVLSKYNLVGSTALSLNPGHRKSINIDHFTDIGYDASYLVNSVAKTYNAAKDGAIAMGYMTSGTSFMLTLPSNSYLAGTGSTGSVSIPTAYSKLSLTEYDGTNHFFYLIHTNTRKDTLLFMIEKAVR